MNDPARFWSKVDTSAGPLACWPWQGGIKPGGYGQFYWDDRSVGAHVASYLINVGPIPAGMEIDHACHPSDGSCRLGDACPHRRCVNPAHLQVLTSGANTLRGVGRSAENARKTHCPQGHPFTPENTMRPPDGARHCRACARASRRRWWRARQLTAPAAATTAG